MTLFKNILQTVKPTEIIKKYIETHKDEFICIEGDNLVKLQKCLLYMLKDIDSFFENNGLRYCISGGTLLGKIRHNGFIPWDDDLDIIMPREDYDKLKQVFEKSNDDFCRKYDFYGPGYSKGAIVRFGKIYKNDSILESIIRKDNTINKVFIDIFPMDYVPDNNVMMYIRGILTLAIISIINCVEVAVNGKKDFISDFGLQFKINRAIRKFVGFFFSFYPLENWYNLLDKVSRNTSLNKESKRVTFPTGALFYLGEIIPAEVYYPFKRTDFCGVSTWIPNQPEKYLENRYGDWKKIPELKDRESHYVRVLDVGEID